MRCQRESLLVLTTLLVGCAQDPASPLAPAAPTVGLVAAQEVPGNVLAALVSARVADADSAAVRYRLDGATLPGDSTTPAATLAGEATEIPVLGLLPASRYLMRVVAFGPGGTSVGDPVAFTTGSLPPDLPTYSASGPDPSPGYVVFAAGPYGLAIDNTGRVVWYHHFPGGTGLSFMAQGNGRYVARPSTPDPTDVETWVEVDPLGNTTRTLGCAMGLQPRVHDLIVEPAGGYWLLCDETRTMDLTTLGGFPAARVTGTAVQHISAGGALLLHWSPFDHFDIADLDPAERMGPTINWTHGNALDLDVDGGLIVSFRNLGEVTKINAATGALVWRLGGVRNQFAFPNSTLPAFVRQHATRIAEPGVLLLLDNLGSALESRAERYLVDAGARTARLDRAFGPIPGVITPIGGSVQPLPEGRLLVSFGTAGRVEEYDAGGRMMWRIDGAPGYVFRAQRIRSLYAPGVGTTR